MEGSLDALNRRLPLKWRELRGSILVLCVCISAVCCGLPSSRGTKSTIPVFEPSSALWHSTFEPIHRMFTFPVYFQTATRVAGAWLRTPATGSVQVGPGVWECWQEASLISVLRSLGRNATTLEGKRVFFSSVRTQISGYRSSSA